MNKYALLFVGILVCNEPTIECAQGERAVGQTIEHRVCNLKYFCKTGIAVALMLWAGVSFSPLIFPNYCGNRNNLDLQRPVICANVYYRDFSWQGRFANICVHTQEPFQQTEYEFVPKSLKNKCLHPPVKSPQWKLLPEEEESLKNSEGLLRYAHSAHFGLLCRYSPQ